MNKKPVKEIAKPCGDRIYKKHRVMLKAIAKVEMLSVAEALRLSIEEKYGRTKQA